MPIPFIVAGVAAVAAAYGGKKAYDGYQTKSKADDIVDDAKSCHATRVAELEKVSDSTTEHLSSLGTLEMQVGKDFNEFSLIADNLLDIPKHNIDIVTDFSITATEYLTTITGAGAASAAAGFAMYGGVMSLGAASTGTAISTLSGAAAYNAVMAALGGGSIAAGGFGMAGGAIVLGGACLAPVLAIAGWAYNSHAEKALEDAYKARDEVQTMIFKMDQAEKSLKNVQLYIWKLLAVLQRDRELFNELYLTPLKEVNSIVEARHAQGLKGTGDMDDTLQKIINNGFAMAALMTSLIVTPLFEMEKDTSGKPVMKDGVPTFKIDDNGMKILNISGLNDALSNVA